MSTQRDAGGPPSDPNALWSEALWGLGLMGSVILSVVLIAALFGR
jgi:hypothetical protein